MKTAADPRHQIRREAIKQLFAGEFAKQPMHDLAIKVQEKRSDIDQLITDSAPAWPIEKLNKIDLAILRLAVYEMRFTDTPPKVIIDEAVELAKEFGSESSASFVNGVLGTILAKQDKNETENS